MTALKTVQIIGGGLAGLSLGIALRKAGVPAVIFEAHDYPRHRVCGEFVAGLGEDIVEKLGIAPAFAGSESPKCVTWFWHEHVVNRQTLPSPARAISRFVLDARLAALFVADGGKLATRTRADLPHDPCGWVQASGRSRNGASAWVGLKVHARGMKTADDLELHLGDGAYVGVSAVEEGWINVCGLFSRRPGLRLDRGQALPNYLHASGLHVLAERVSAAQIRPESTCAVAGFSFDRRIAKDGGLRLGDASAMIPPFTGNGMAMAFTGAALALDPLVAWATGEQSWTDTRHEVHRALHHAFRLRLNGATLFHPFLLKPSLQRCLATAARTKLLPLTSLYRLVH